MKQFKPVSLVSSIYKLIGKVLARRMAKVINKVIGDCRHVLVEGRQTMDAAWVANKVVDELIF